MQPRMKNPAMIIPDAMKAIREFEAGKTKMSLRFDSATMAAREPDHSPRRSRGLVSMPA